MAHASKHTRTETRTVTEEVVTYTLELSEAEREAVLAAIQRDGSPLRALDTVYEALTNAAQPRPLAVGDRVRVERDYEGWAESEVCEVIDADPDEDGDVRVRSSADGKVGYLPASSGIVWERC